MKLVLFTAMVTASSFSIAPMAWCEDYRTDITGNYSEFDYDFYSGDNYSTNVNWKQYFSSVDTANLPLAEAAFLRKASSFSLSLVKNDFENDYSSQESDVRSASISYFVPNSIFFVGAGITQNKYSYEYRYDNQSEPTKGTSDWASRWNATLGVAPVDGLQIWSDFFEHVDVSDHWNLHAKYVKPLADQRAFGVEVNYFENREVDSNAVQVSADYYFTHRFSLGAGVSQYWDDAPDEGDDTSYSLHARHFFTENTSVQISYADSDYSDSWQLGGTVRF